jgi:hypothetical protein
MVSLPAATSLGAAMELSNLPRKFGGYAMSRSSVAIFASNDEWSVMIVEFDGESLHSFRFQKQAQSFADGQRLRMGFPLTDFAACGNGNAVTIT